MSAPERNRPRKLPPVEPHAVVVNSSPMKRKAESPDIDAPDSSDLKTSRGFAGLVSRPLHTPVSIKSGKGQRAPRATESTRASPHTPMSNIGSPGDAPVRSRRSDKSLELLTKRFIALINSAEDGTLDLSQAAVTLKAKKRRLYDIINVLEGIGLVEKKRVNTIQWKESVVSRPCGTKDNVSRLQADIENLSIKEHGLDEQIREMQERLREMNEDKNIQKWLFVTEQDIKCSPSFQSDTLIVIKAPPSTNLEVPDPDEAVDDAQRRYQMVLRSTEGPINVYLVSRCEEKFEEINGTDADSSLPGISSDNEETITENESISNEFDIGREGSQRVCSEASDVSAPQDFLTKIVPEDDSDTDYWLMLDTNVSITDMWRSEPEAYTMENMSTSEPQISPSPSP